MVRINPERYKETPKNRRPDLLICTECSTGGKTFTIARDRKDDHNEEHNVWDLEAETGQEPS